MCPWPSSLTVGELAQPIPVMTALNSLIDCFRWVGDCLERSAPLVGLDADSAWSRLADVIPATSLSTCFSGIGAPEQAATSLSAAVCGHLSERTPGHIRSLYAVEWSQGQRRELQSMAHPPQHVYVDMNSFWSQDELGNGPCKMTSEELEACLVARASRSRCIKTAAPPASDTARIAGRVPPRSTLVEHLAPTGHRKGHEQRKAVRHLPAQWHG